MEKQWECSGCGSARPEWEHRCFVCGWEPAPECRYCGESIDSNEYGEQDAGEHKPCAPYAAGVYGSQMTDGIEEVR